MNTIKTAFIAFFLLSSCLTSFSQEQAQISLTITYEGKALCDWDITVKIGDAVLGKGVTDKSGYIKFAQAAIIAKDVDVYGYKKTANGEKKWDMKGYVKLDDNYYHHIKMETVVEEVTKGGGLPKSMLLDAWGLTSLNCDGSVTTEQNNSTNNNTNTNSTPTENKEETVDPNAGLQQQKIGYQNQINSFEKRIPKKESELAEKKSKGLLAPIDERIEQLEIDELKIKLDERKLGLERINKSIENSINETQRDEYLKREKDMREQARTKDDERRKLVKEKKDAEREVKKENEGDKKSAGEKMDDAGVKLKIKYYKSEINAQEKAVVRLKEKGKMEEAAKKEQNIEELKAKLAEAEAKLVEE